MSSETKRAVGVILIYIALLSGLIGWAASMKSDFHYRAEISTAGYYTAGALAALGIISILFSLGKQR
jgi:hypothetical protein